MHMHPDKHTHIHCSSAHWNSLETMASSHVSILSTHIVVLKSQLHSQEARASWTMADSGSRAENGQDEPGQSCHST